MKKITFITSLLALLFSANALANDAKTLCVYDPSGANGDAFATMKDYQIAAASWGIDFELKPYTNEKTAADDFKTDKCDAVFLTGLRARDFNKFVATLEAMGALPSYDLLHDAVKLLSKPQAAKYMKAGNYETTLIMPMGAVYLLVKDKSNKSMEDLAGKKITTIDFDQAAKFMVKKAGASMVSADISTFAGIFNNGAADACYAPATAFKPLELEKGIKENGGIVKYPIAQLTGQVLIKADTFPENFAQNSRQWGEANFKKILTLSTKADKTIDKKYWIEINDEDKQRYDQLFQEVRIELRDKANVYEKQTLTLLRRVRCNKDKNRPECAEKKE